MNEKHKDCLHALGLPTIQIETQDKTNASHVEEPLKLFLNMPIYELMAGVLSIRRLASQFDSDKSSGRFKLNMSLQYEAVHELTRRFSDIETYVINNDRTLFSSLAHKYEIATVHLLAQREVEGIPPAILRAFQEAYASTAFRCRFPNCDRLSLGFATPELRLEHETVHIQRVYCQTESCQYSHIGFAKRNALTAHTRKHHGNVLLIPAKVRRTTDRSSATLSDQSINNGGSPFDSINDDVSIINCIYPYLYANTIIV
jgi:hypothetical protein